MYIYATKNDPKQQQLYEDEIIAWTWRMFLTEKKDQPEWLARLPMTKVKNGLLIKIKVLIDIFKAVVRGFDTMASFSTKFGVKLNKFMICGESKVIILNSYFGKKNIYTIFLNYLIERLDNLDRSCS